MPINEVVKVIINVENVRSGVYMNKRVMIAYLIYSDNSCFEATVEEIAFTNISESSCKLYTMPIRTRNHSYYKISEADISFNFLSNFVRKEFIDEWMVRYIIDEITQFEIAITDSVEELEFGKVVEREKIELHSNILSKDIAMKFYKEIPLPEEYKKYL